MNRARFSLLLAFVIACIAVDALGQVWVEWKQFLWGEMGMAIREKLALSIRRTFSSASR